MTTDSTNEFALRKIVVDWLRLRAAHAPEGEGWSFSQLADEVDHSDVLLRLFRGEKPPLCDEGKDR